MTRLLKLIISLLRRITVTNIFIVFYRRIIRGFRLYKSIITCGNPLVNDYWLMEYWGTGDTFLCCSFLNAVGKISESICFISSGDISGNIASAYPFGGIKRLLPKDAFAIREMQRFYGSDIKIKPLLFESDTVVYSGVMRHMICSGRFDFMTMLKLGFEIYLDIPFSENQPDLLPIPFSMEEYKSATQNLPLIPGKTILIIPYANSEKKDWKQVDISFWETIVATAKQKGYQVFTNSAGADEPAIKGTLPLKLPFRFLEPFVESGGIFISVRNGLADILSMSRGTKKIILCPEEWDHHGAKYSEYFSVLHMGICHDAYEYAYNSKNQDLLCSQITSLL